MTTAVVSTLDCQAEWLRKVQRTSTYIQKYQHKIKVCRAFNRLQSLIYQYW